MAFLSRAWPANDALLTELFEIRREHAHLLGYADWAEYDAEVKMIKHGTAIPEFIPAGSPTPRWRERDRQVVLDRMRQDYPDAETIDASDLAYYAEAVSVGSSTSTPSRCARTSTSRRCGAACSAMQGGCSG